MVINGSSCLREGDFPIKVPFPHTFWTVKGISQSLSTPLIVSKLLQSLSQDILQAIFPKMHTSMEKSDTYFQLFDKNSA